MEVNWLRKWEESICIDIFYGKRLSEAETAIIYLYGMPGKPLEKNSNFVKEFVKEGLLIFSPHYKGTYESYSCFRIRGAMDTLEKTVEFIMKGKVVNLLNRDCLEWRPKHLFFIGESFGGSLALIASSLPHVDGLIVLAAPVDYEDHNKTYEEEDIRSLIRYVNIFYPNSWRFCDEYKEHPLKLINDLIEEGNPKKYLKKLKKKKVLAIHGKKDKSVNFNRSKFLIEFLGGIKEGKRELIALNEGHTNFEKIICKSEIRNKIMTFLGVKK